MAKNGRPPASLDEWLDWKERLVLYFPNRNYPQHGYGGWLEPVGDWAYVHE